MSLVSLALRLCAVKSIAAGETLARPERVFDSAIMPIDALISTDPEPFVSVSTEDEEARPAGRDINNGDRTIDLVIETAIAAVRPLENVDGVEIAIADTDANLELSLAILSRQITACLWGDGGGLWGDAFRSFSKHIDKITTRRGLPTKDGQRFAARQLVITIKSLAEPPFAKPIEAGTPFAKLFLALASEPAMADYASILRNAIEGRPVDWPAINTLSAINAGLTEAEGQAIGIAPLGGHTSAPVAGMTLDPGGEVFDADLIETGLPPEPEEGE